MVSVDVKHHVYFTYIYNHMVETARFGGRSDLISKWIVCHRQHSPTVETAHGVGFNLSQKQNAMFRTDERHLPANERPSFGLK